MSCSVGCASLSAKIAEQHALSSRYQATRFNLIKVRPNLEVPKIQLTDTYVNCHFLILIQLTHQSVGCKKNLRLTDHPICTVAEFCMQDTGKENASTRIQSCLGTQTPEP